MGVSAFFGSCSKALRRVVVYILHDACAFSEAYCLLFTVYESEKSSMTSCEKL